MNQSYASDVCLEPIFWFVDNFAQLLGPVSSDSSRPPTISNTPILYSNKHFSLQFFVFGVAVLTTAVVFISYWVGLPFWWKKSPEITVILLFIGNWLLVNVVFHYYMAAATPPGIPPEVSKIRLNKKKWEELINVFFPLNFSRVN